MKTKPTLSYLSQSKNPTTHYIVEKVNRLRQLDNLIHSLLEPQLASFCRVANFEKGRLVIQVSNAAFATRLRLKASSLLDLWSQIPELLELDQIEIVVYPFLQDRPQMVEKPKHPPISPDNQELLKCVAQDIEHAALREVLIKLANRK